MRLGIQLVRRPLGLQVKVIVPLALGGLGSELLGYCLNPGPVFDCQP
jgi:hypothetical protein